MARPRRHIYYPSTTSVPTPRTLGAVATPATGNPPESVAGGRHPTDGGES
jgi:hypothetical protein